MNEQFCGKGMSFEGLFGQIFSVDEQFCGVCGQISFEREQFGRLFGQIFRLNDKFSSQCVLFGCSFRQIFRLNES